MYPVPDYEMAQKEALLCAWRNIQKNLLEVRTHTTTLDYYFLINTHLLPVNQNI